MSSKFASLLSQARNRPNDEDQPEAEQGSEQATLAQETEQTPVITVTAPAASTTKNKATKANSPTRQKSTPTKVEAEETHVTEGGVRGRPRTGKRSDPNYTQITAYITKSTHRDVKLALLQEDKGREISEVIEELLASWLSNQK